MIFNNREDAGRKLAAKVQAELGRDVDLVLALPRGGVPVGYYVAEKLEKPLDVFTVRKIGVPGHEEYAVGAMGPDKEPVLDETVLQRLRIAASDLQQIIDDESKELDRRSQLYRQGRDRLSLKDKNVLLVDDGLATGSTMLAACLAAKNMQPKSISVAVPVGSRSAFHALNEVADAIICNYIPEPFSSVGQWYDKFDQTSDEEVIKLLEKNEANV